MAQDLRRIIGHWTAGGGRASDLDREYYHLLVEHDGKVVIGDEEPCDNIVTADGDYAAHTLNLNTGSIGVAVCGMRDAIEHPFSPGPSPINTDQFEAFCMMIAELCRSYGIAVTPETVLTHAEVEPTLGVKQRGKWDIARLPWREDIRGARAVGDFMRSRVSVYLGEEHNDHVNRPILRMNARGVAVAELQSDLADLGYFSGRLDGDYGPLTRAAVLAFQADSGLITDAVVGPRTWAALSEAEPRPPRLVSQEQIDEESGTAKDALMTARTGDLVGLAGVAGVATQATEAAQATSGALGVMTSMVQEHWPVLVLFGVCLVAWVALRAISLTTRRRRLRDAREHRSLAR